MTDLPPGEWSEILVGHQWPTSATLTTLASAAANRGLAAEAYEGYANVLNSIRTGTLANQEGVTADDARDAFQAGEDHARVLSRQSAEKQRAYESATRSVNELRSELTTVADDGNAEIRNIQSSKDLPVTKLGKIVDVVLRKQTEASARAGRHADNIYDAVQQIFKATGTDYPARKFAQDHGVNPNFGSSSKDAVEQSVKAKLDNAGSSTPGSAGGDFLRNSGTATLPDQSNPYTNSHNSTGVQTLANAGAPQAGSTSTPIPTDSNHNILNNSQSVLNGQGITSTPGPATSSLASGPPSTAGVGPGQMPAVQQATTSGVGMTPPSAPSVHSSSASTPANPLSPEGFAQNFNSGAQAGGPMSSGAEGLSNTAAHAMQPQAPIHPESMAAPPAYTAPTAGAPLFENAHATPTYDTAQAPVAPPADTTQTYMAAPASQAPVMPSTAAPAAPAGPLPAYGADLRPAAATAPAAPPPMPSAAAPASAPVHPSSGSALNQPAVVRQTPGATPIAQAPAGLTESAVAATGAGAVAGASAAQTQAQQRLQRLLDAVARQEPQLRWAIGEREDGTTVLTTDLASGWIPPHVEIPTGVKLLAPRARAKTLEALLGETTLTATYAPGQYLPPVEDTEPTQMSIRARDLHDVDELGWELAQATKWRDGLPRLALTLAKAASTGTGYLDSEVELLREHLATVARQVLGDYPDHSDAAKVGNWQLLATIDALIKNEKTAANYHFAWFQALSLALKGEVHP